MYIELYCELISYPKYGVPVVEGVFVMLAVSWLVFFLSKLIFKQFFSHKFWKAAFIVMVAAPSLIEIYIGSINALTTYPLFGYFEPETMMGFADVRSFHIVLFPLFVMFTLGYLSEFIVRLVRRFTTAKIVDHDWQ
jgi:hypothetical protein